ncbi:MAG: hypothetical protein Q8O56_01755 [Solirubrobacteraceae bacterium]|nr:hypothetical protein [Solirubrobacteraceae bacterium]
MTSDPPTAADPATLQSRLEVADDERPPSAAEATIHDPVALLHHLDVRGHFHRDSRVGRLFHRGMVSLRENVAADSLHVSVDGNRLTAHVDQVSPLTERADGGSGYSLRRALAHNVAGMTQDLLWVLRGRQGDHRCELNCEWLTPAAQRAATEIELLDPATGAWSVQLEARVAGALDEPRLRAALGSALGSATVEDGLLDVVRCPDDEALAGVRSRLPVRAVPVTDRAPLHVCLARHPAGDVLMLSLNHAAADGVGALRVLERIARAYAGEADPVAPLDFLATRDLPVRPATTTASVLRRSYKRVFERVRDSIDRPALLIADQARDRSGCGFHLVGLSAQETRRLVGTQGSGIGAEVLVAALHLAIGDWNRQHGGDRRRIGVLAQVDLRPARWRDEAIANFSVMARMSTSRRDRVEPASALATIGAQIARNERTRTGVALIAALERADLLVLWAKQSIVVLQPLTGNHWVDTTVLCDLGSLDEAPSFGPDAGATTELWFSTPARAPGSLCIGTVTIDDRLHLTFRYPHRLFGPDAARRFAQCYIERLRSVATVGISSS